MSDGKHGTGAQIAVVLSRHKELEAAERALAATRAAENLAGKFEGILWWRHEQARVAVRPQGSAFRGWKPRWING